MNKGLGIITFSGIPRQDRQNSISIRSASQGIRVVEKYKVEEYKNYINIKNIQTKKNAHVPTLLETTK